MHDTGFAGVRRSRFDYTGYDAPLGRVHTPAGEENDEEVLAEDNPEPTTGISVPATFQVTDEAVVLAAGPALSCVPGTMTMRRPDVTHLGTALY